MKAGKKISLLLAVLLLFVPVMTGCEKGSTSLELETKYEIENKSVEDITKLTNDSFGSIMTTTPIEKIEEYIASGQHFVSVPFDNSFLARWKSFVELHGQVVDAVARETEAEEDGFVSHIVLTGEDGEMMRLNITYDHNGTPYMTTIEPYAEDADKTFGQKMAEAGMNTLVGIFVVFAVLVLLTLVISAFKYVGNIGKKSEKAAAPAKAAAPVKAAPAAPAAPAAQDDSQLIAVIAAAIAASEGTSTDAFVVRSIRRLKNNRW